MRDFYCPNCGQRLVFENSRCLSCGNTLGLNVNTGNFQVVDGDENSGPEFSLCSNRAIAACNWLAPSDAAVGLCCSCALTRTRPSDSEAEQLPAFADAEAAKRRLVFELLELGLPIVGRELDPENGLCFDLLSSAREPVITGHADGVITLDLAESDDVHREQLRVSMDEPYRTLLGHFRHEVGHFYFTLLASDGPARKQFEELFGDPDADYQAALDRHYSEGPPEGWQDAFISSYATMHPAEDWAETFAHYLHIRDTVDTASAFGFAPAVATDFAGIIELWLPLAWALNMINRSMGHPDLYPFVLPPAAIEKLALVHQLISDASPR